MAAAVTLHTALRGHPTWAIALATAAADFQTSLHLEEIKIDGADLGKDVSPLETSQIIIWAESTSGFEVSYIIRLFAGIWQTPARLSAFDRTWRGAPEKNLLWCRSLSANVRRANGFVCHQASVFCLEISKYIGTMTSNRVAHATSIALPCTWLQQEFSPSLFLQTLFPLFGLFWGEILRRLRDHRFLRGVWHVSTLKRKSGWDGCQEGLDLNIGGLFVARRSLHTLFLPVQMDALVPLGLQTTNHTMEPKNLGMYFSITCFAKLLSNGYRIAFT